MPMDPAAATRRLAEHGIRGSSLILATWAPGGDVTADDLNDALGEAGVDHLLLRREDCTVTLLVEGEHEDESLARLLPEPTHIGLSDPFTRPAQAADALKQAIWALEVADASGKTVVRYGEHHAPFLPRTLSEAHSAVDHVLGPLIAYDQEKSSDLINTLRVFLENKRSWKQASELLCIHKQTLIYRIRRVEELTGRTLDETRDVAELWYALRTLELIGGRDRTSGTELMDRPA